MSRLVVILALICLVAGACRGTALEDAELDPTTTQAPGSPTTTESPATTTTPSTTTALATTTMPPPSPEELGVIAYNRAGELWLINADGTDTRALVTSVAVEGAPSWSPDGTKLAFTGFEWGPQIIIWDIWIVGVDGSELTNLTRSSETSVLSPSWSPDGSQIVFVDTHWDLWVIDVDGSDRKRITSDVAHQSSPAWAPDGSLIAYCSLPVTGGLMGSNDIWVIEPDGTDPTRLTDRGDSCLPAWAPDSSQIAFTAFVFAQDASGDHSDIWVMQRDGSGQRNLTNDPARFDRAPAWSPDGTTIAFDSAGPLRGRQDPDRGVVIEHDPPADVYLVDAGGGPKTRLTTGVEPEGAPAWRPLP